MSFSKKGEGKYDAIISAILAIMVMSVAFYFIFQEYFSSEDIDLETCRQSIVLRNSLPDADLKIGKVSFKDKFPLKCKTDVLTIDYEDVERAEKEIAEEMVSCWYLYGNGEYSIFPAASWSIDSYCSFCSRVHIDESVVDYYNENKISLKGSLLESIDETQTYWEYLQNVGKEPALIFVGGWEDAFRVDSIKRGWWPLSAEIMKLYFPENLDTSKGDLFIVVSSVVFDESKSDTYLLFLQEDSLEELDKYAFKSLIGSDYKVCNSYETIPA